jgi:hypothetical protein
MADDPPTLSREDYTAIEAAVMETSRGRWFLAEYARRNRQADTLVLMEALQRIESSVGMAQHGGADAARLRQDLADVADALGRAKRDLATSVSDSAGPGGTPSAERAYDDVVRVAERADADVFAIAEHVQEIAWGLRERQALELYRASNQHALTTNRVRAIIGVLRVLESRLGAVGGPVPVDADGTSRLDIASRDSRNLIDAAPPRIRDDIVFVEHRGGRDPRDREQRRLPEPSAPARAPAPSRSVPDDPRHRAFVAIDALTAEQKLALFA